MKTEKKKIIAIISIICVASIIAGGLVLFAGSKKNKSEASESNASVTESTTAISPAAENISEIIEENKTNVTNTTAKTDSSVTQNQTVSTTTAANSNKVPEKKTENIFLEATQSDINKLGVSTEDNSSWLNRMRFNIEMGDIDFSKMSAEDFWESYFRSHAFGETSSLYSYYFNDAEIINTSKHPDPNGIFDLEPFGDAYTGSYCKLKAKNVEWIMKEIFGITPTRKLKYPQLEYYCDGYYYISQTYYSVDDLVKYTVNSYKQLPDGRYEIKVDGWFEPTDSITSTGTIIAGIKNINGVRQWVFYEMSFSELPQDSISE